MLYCPLDSLLYASKPFFKLKKHSGLHPHYPKLRFSSTQFLINKMFKVKRATGKLK